MHAGASTSGAAIRKICAVMDGLLAEAEIVTAYSGSK
jgi:hypothetical protein